MSYAVVYRGNVVGHTDLEVGANDADVVSGRLRPTRHLAGVEKALRTHTSEQVRATVAGGRRILVSDFRSGRSLGALDVAIMDDKGRRLPYLSVRVFWPGDIPGRNYLGVLAVKSGLATA